MALLVLYVLLAVGVSFLCSILEAVLLSVTPAYIGALQEERPAAAERLSTLKSSVDRPLAAILSLNTIAHTVGAAGSGAQAARVFGDTTIGVFSALLTFIILVFSEIIPKTLGATWWKTLAPLVSLILPWLIVSMYPLVKMSQGLTWLLGSSHGSNAVSRDELAALADVGQQEGVVEESESRIVRNLLRLSSLRTMDVMTPRTVVFALPDSTTVGQVLERSDELRFSRIPIFDRDIDHITGIVLKDDILLEAARDHDDVPISDLRRDVLHFPRRAPLRQVFDRLLQAGEHIGVVIDEYGGTAGLVTLEDVVETLLGLEIVDEADDTMDLQALARERWQHRARRLGMLDDGNDPGGAERTAEAVVRYGITGGVPGPDEPVADAPADAPTDADTKTD